MKYSPMLCQTQKEPFDNKNWLFEQKIDGIRIIAVKKNGKVKLLTRNGSDKSKQFPEVVQVLQALRSENIILDGEIAALRYGKSDFQALQPRIQQTNPGEIELLLKKQPVFYYIFDLLEIAGTSWLNRPVLDRKRQLKTILSRYKNKTVQYLDHIIGSGKDIFKEAKRKKWEGIIGKQITSFYLPGKRSLDWIKLKTRSQQEFVIGGYTKGFGKARNSFGALLLGYYEDGDLVYIGKVGTGFTDSTRQFLIKKMAKLQRVNQPFSDSRILLKERVQITWLKPELVGEFAFANWTRDKMLRSPVFLGLREDKPAKEVTIF